MVGLTGYPEPPPSSPAVQSDDDLCDLPGHDPTMCQVSSITQNRTFAFGPASRLTATVSSKHHRAELEPQVRTLPVPHDCGELLAELTDHLSQLRPFRHDSSKQRSHTTRGLGGI